MKAAIPVALALLSGLPVLEAADPKLDIQIVYDNTSARPDMKADWGFAAVVDFNAHRLLFDAGTEPALLMENLEKMKIGISSIEKVVISHTDNDHIKGLTAITDKRPKLEVRLPGSEAPVELLAGVYSTGTLPGPPPEQALVIETSTGLVVFTGCGHPGVVRIVETARAQHGNKPVRLLIGGFHMLNDKPEQVTATIARLRELQIAKVVPLHCTGVDVIRQFREAFGAGFQEGGAGRRIVLD